MASTALGRLKRLNKMIRQGEANSADLLHNEYGMSPVAGGWIIPYHIDLEHEIQPELSMTKRGLNAVCTIWETPILFMLNMKSFNEQVDNTAKASHIQVNMHAKPPLMPSRVGSVGHEGIHILQNQDHRNEVLIARRPHSPNDIHLSYYFGFGKEMEEVFLSAENEEQTKVRRAKLLENRFLKPGYLFRCVELQARMHTLLAWGYHTWQAVPQNKHELWAAMESCGLELPPRIACELADSDEGKAAREKFTPLEDKRPILLEQQDFAEMRRTLNEEQYGRFWETVLPVHGGTLLELYGDPEGRKKYQLEPVTFLRQEISRHDVSLRR